MEVLRNTDLFENILQGITDPVLLLTKDLTILWTNKAFQNQTGYSREEIIGNHCFRITHRNNNPCMSPDDVCPVSVSLKTGEAATTTHTHYDKEGKKIFVEVCAYPIRDTNGEIFQFAYILRDITEKMRVAEELNAIITESRKQQAEMGALLKGAHAIMKYHDFHGAARSIFDSCKELIGATSGYIALLSKDGTENEVLFLDPGGLPCSVDPNLPMPIRGLRAEAYNKVETVHHNDFSNSKWNEFMPEGHVRLENVLFAPLVVERKTVGLLGIANKPGGFTENDAHIASAFAELAAIALVNKRAEEELQTARKELEKRVEERTEELAQVNKKLEAEITEHRQAETRIQATNELLKLFISKSSKKEYLDSVVELMHIWSGCHYVGTRVLDTYGSIPFESYIGYSHEFWESENWLSLQNHQCACIRVVQQQPEAQDLPVMTPGGSFRCDDTNTFFGALPEKKKERFRGVCFQSGFTSLAIIPIRFKDKVIGAVHLADEKEGMVPLNIVEFIESISPLIGEGVHRFSTEEELMKYQHHLEELVEERTGMLKAATEKLQQEVTERKLAAEEVLRTKVYLESILNNSMDLIVTLKKDGTISYINPQSETITGYRPEEVKGKHLSEFIPQHLRESMFQKWEEINKGIPGRYETEIIKADGTLMHCLISQSIVEGFDEILISLKDITSRKMMEEALLRSHAKLETRVKERTYDLEKANRELRKLSAHLQSVREEERKKIARDIHDDLGQVLTALKIEVSMLANKLRSDKKLFEKAESIVEKIDDTIQSVKKICASLRPTILDHFGLSAAIEWQMEEFKTLTGIKGGASFEPREIILDQDLSTTVFRIFQEALTNIARHANATEVRVHLQLKDGKMLLKVKDNGKGITKRQLSDPTSFGIMGIRERVHYLSGNVTIDGMKDKGTTLMVSIPLSNKEVS
jgi:PAS domain S-box-containing protein